MPTASQPPSRLARRPAVPQPLFGLEAVKDGGAFLIRLSGELDLAQCPRLNRALAESEASNADSVLLDLEELTFIDAAGLFSLFVASSRSAEDGSRLRITRGKGPVAAIFHLTSLDAVLPFGSA